MPLIPFHRLGSLRTDTPPGTGVWVDVPPGGASQFSTYLSQQSGFSTVAWNTFQD